VTDWAAKEGVGINLGSGGDFGDFSGTGDFTLGCAFSGEEAVGFGGDDDLGGEVDRNVRSRFGEVSRFSSDFESAGAAVESETGSEPICLSVSLADVFERRASVSGAFDILVSFNNSSVASKSS